MDLTEIINAMMSLDVDTLRIFLELMVIGILPIGGYKYFRKIKMILFLIDVIETASKKGDKSLIKMISKEESLLRGVDKELNDFLEIRGYKKMTDPVLKKILSSYQKPSGGHDDKIDQDKQ